MRTLFQISRRKRFTRGLRRMFRELVRFLMAPKAEL